MPAIVIDASALIAVVFGEPEGEAIREQCRGAQLLAPQLLDYEVANICLVKQRRHPDITDKLARQFSAFQLLELQRLPVHIGEVRTLAAQTNITAYDAAYLWLALQHDCPLRHAGQCVKQGDANASAKFLNLIKRPHYLR